jgi:hypothetical protein
MRTKRFLIGTCVVVGAMVVPSTAFGLTADQTIDAILGGKTTPKFDKKKFKGTSIEVTTTTADAANPSGMPPKATNAKITFDKKDMKFDPKVAPTCSASQISGTTTEAALAVCGPAKVGDGDASAALPFGVGATRQDFPAVVTAFNSADQKGILLHSRVGAPLNTTTTLVGTLSGTVLNVVVPPLGGGIGAISLFHTTVKHGKYVQGRCKSKTIKTDSEFTFTDAPVATAQDTQKCKQKSSNKH